MNKKCLALLGAFAVLGMLAVPPLSAADTISLPTPRYPGTISLEEALNRTRTVRVYSDKALTLQEISALLWAAGGRRYDAETGASRSYPSAGGIYPLELCVVAGAVEGLQPGVYKYLWKNHSLSLIEPGDVRSALGRAALFQNFIALAPAIIVIAADYDKTSGLYGERGKARYVPLDAGHASQNIRLMAAAMDLNVGIVGAFIDEAVKRVLGFRDEDPLLIIPAGHPK